MARDTEYQFLDTDSDTLLDQLTSAYEAITGTIVRPASPEYIFISWVASIILQERALTNYVGNQNLPSRAEGENLDALASLFYMTDRPEATAATCTVRFYISEPQDSAVLIPEGTRVTDSDGTLVWETTEAAYVASGQTYADLQAKCQTAGVIGNGFKAGQINTAVDLYDYYSGCENITESGNGSDEASDDEFYELLRDSQDAYSVAGSKGGYIYHAKAVNSDIADVVVSSPSPGKVVLYVLMDDGSIAGTEVKNAVEDAVNEDEIRPLTDYVTVEDPEEVEYDINVTYYVNRTGSLSASEIADLVNTAVEDYQLWQAGALGRDINPSRLISTLMETGIKRVDVAAPAYKSLADGSDGTVPQVAKVRQVTITSGGYENE
jgi:phage-related baseplate assembly protein